MLHFLSYSCYLFLDSYLLDRYSSEILLSCARLVYNYLVMYSILHYVFIIAPIFSILLSRTLYSEHNAKHSVVLFDLLI